MDSWRVEDSRLSYLRPAPSSFSLYDREGPNRVEIFDITRIPSCRRTISETTSLGDIFGDDCEPLSCSPPVGLPVKVVEEELHLAEDPANDSPGSYRTTNGSEQLSDSSDTFEDSKEALSPVPPLAVSSSVFKGVSPTPNRDAADVSSDPLAPPVCTQPKGIAFSQGVGSLSLSPEPRSTNSPLTQRTSGTPLCPSVDPTCSNLSSEHSSVDISPKSVAAASPCQHRDTTLSPETSDTDIFYETTSSPLSPDDVDILYANEQGGTDPWSTAVPLEPTPAPPELHPRASPSKTDHNFLSQKAEFKASTTQFENRAEVPEPELGCRNTSPAAEVKVLSAKPEPRSAFPEPGLRFKSLELKQITTSPKREPNAKSPVPESGALSSKQGPGDISPFIQLCAISPKIEPGAASSDLEFRNSSPEPKYGNPYPECDSTLPEPECKNPSPEQCATLSELEVKDPTSEPCVTSPKPEFIVQYPESNTTLSESECWNPSSELYTASREPEFRNLALKPNAKSLEREYSPFPEFRTTCPQPELRNLSPELSATSTEPEFRNPSLEYSVTIQQPEFRNLSPESCATSPEPEFRNQARKPSPRVQQPEFRNQFSEPSTIIQQQEFRNLPPESSATSPESEFRNELLEPSTRLQQPEFRNPSLEPGITSPQSKLRNLSPESSSSSSEAEFRTPPLEPEPSATLPHPEPRNQSPEPDINAASLKPEPISANEDENTNHLLPDSRISPSSLKPQDFEISNELKGTLPSTESTEMAFISEATITAHLHEPRVNGPTKNPRVTQGPSCELGKTYFPESRNTCLSLESKTAGLDTQSFATWTETQSTALSSEVKNSEISNMRSVIVPADCTYSDLSELEGRTSVFPGTAEVLESGERDHLLISIAETSNTGGLLEPGVKERGRMITVPANSNASEGLQSADPLSSTERVLIRSPGDKNSEASLLRQNAAEGQEPICRSQEFKVSTSGEIPIVPCWLGGSQPHWGVGQRGGVEGVEREREERGGDEGEGSRGKASYGEQQVELSFSARNRSAPVGPGSAPTYREPWTGMPDGCYSDRLPVTRQQQQQNQLRLHDSREEDLASARKPRLVPRLTRNGTSCPAPECFSDASTMGSELDEADNEVKWFSDVAFRSLSSPQADYLEVRKSSYRSSTHVTQLSTEGSLGAGAYADVRESTCQEGKGIPHQPARGLAPDGPDTPKRFEMANFECVDVTLESWEDIRRGKRTVPKRQIQLKRRDTGDSQASENDDVDNEAAPVLSHSRDTLVCQHSRPAISQELIYTEAKFDPSDRKQKLQNSISSDDTSNKTKTATGLIKSVLSKKMQHNQNLNISQPSLLSTDSGSTGGGMASSESSTSIRDTSNVESSNLSIELPSDCSLSEEDLPHQVEHVPRHNPVKQHQSLDLKTQPKPPYRLGYSPPQSGARGSEFQNYNAVKLGMRSELVVPFESAKAQKQSGRDSWTQSSGETEKRRSKGKDKECCRETEKQNSEEIKEQRESTRKLSYRGTEKQRGRDGAKQSTSSECTSDSAKSISGNTRAAATQTPGTSSGITNVNQECHTRSENYKQQSARSTFMSKTPEIMLKSTNTRESKKGTVQFDCLPGNVEPKQEGHMHPILKGLPEKETRNYKMESRTEERTEQGEAPENKPKGPVHKVRDVRKLVKNTYNLSFKATGVAAQESISQVGLEKPPPMQIEYISRRVEGSETQRPGDRELEAEKGQVPARICSPESTQVSAQVDPLEAPQVSALVTAMAAVPKITQSASLLITHRGHVSSAGAATLDTVATGTKSPIVSTPDCYVEEVMGGDSQHPKLGSSPNLPSKDREMSTLMYLQNGPAESELEPGALPPIGLTATSCSRSVSMLLKEKGFHADIGICDSPAEGPCAALKHVNRLEVPLQTCSNEDTPSGAADPVLPPTRTSPAAPTPPRGAREDHHLKNPSPPFTSEVALQRKSLTPRENSTRAQNTTTMSTRTSPPPTSSTWPQETDSKTCTRKAVVTAAATGSIVSSCEDHSSATMQLHSDTQKSPVLATPRKKSPPTISAATNVSHKQKTPPSCSPQENLRHSNLQEEVTLVSSCSSSGSQSSAPATARSSKCSQPTTISISSTKRAKSDSLRYYGTDDPPSYDERESFSPLLLTDVYSRKPNQCQPPAPAAPCSCAASGNPSHGPPNLTPPVPGISNILAPPPHTQAPPCLMAPPPARPQHQQRPDPRFMSFKPSSPKAAHTSLVQPHHPYQSVQHQPPGLPAFPPPLQQLHRLDNTRQPLPGHFVERRPGHHRSPQQPPSLSGSSTYSSHSTQSPGVPPLEVRPPYLCSPQGFVPPFGSEFGGEGGGGSGMLYPEGGGGLGYGQSPRRVLLDPESGKYFYIEVPVQPLRKMLFDPETGQYVEVLIPQQTLPHSSMYPPVAAPYPSIHNHGMYAPQYLPYSVPPHSQSPSPRHPDAPPPQGLHQNNGGYGTPQNQSPKPEPQTHAPLDQSYLESMYYIPTGMTTSPNPAPPEFYQKLPPSLPIAGGKRS